jgi:glycosyltransferase involved in cell wall biosynthesis
LRALVARGHEVGFAFERATLDHERAVDMGVEPLVRWDLQTSTHAEFLSQVSAFRPDIVFLQGCRDETLDFALAQRFRTVLFAHIFYGACATGWRVHRIPARQICTRHFGAACLPVNYLRGCGARNPVQLLHLYSSQRGRSKVLREIAGLVVASEYMRDVYLQHGVPRSDIRVIPCPTEQPPDPLPPEPRKSLDHVLFLGRLTSGKGGTRAIQATARAERALGRSLRLTIAGEGPELPRCQRLALKLGVKTEFPGWVGPAQRLELLRDAAVLIVPSLWPEPFGLVGLEAGSAGVPAVAYRVGGIVDWLRPGETGELAEGRGFGSRALAAALERVLGNAEHHRQLQLGAWRMASEFGAERHLSSLESLFSEIVLRSPRDELEQSGQRELVT